MRRRLLASALLVALGGLVLPAVSPPPASAADAVHRRITFPVGGGGATYSNDFGAPRSGGRTHQGNDLMGAKMTPLLAAGDATVRSVKVDNGISGNMLVLRDADGWEYWYIHVNNDTPGTDDGANPAEHAFAPGIAPGVRVTAGQPVAWLGDSGNAEGTAPHLHFELHAPGRGAVNPYHSLMLSQGRRVGDRCGVDANPPGAPAAAAGAGYWTLASDGGIFTFGQAAFFGSMGGQRLNRPVRGLTASPSGDGYWLVASDGGIFSFGDARFAGSTGAITLNQPIVGMASTPTGAGYWLVASDGGVFAFGDARFLGSTGAIALNQPIVGMASTPTGGGYWMVAADGGIFSFGDAAYHGSTDGSPPSAITSIAAAPDGAGYWLSAARGTVLAYGSAAWHGDVAGVGYCAAPVAVRTMATGTGRGYWSLGADGRVHAFGDAVDHGSTASAGIRTAAPVDIAVDRG
jgi:hypothetical protein